jgi:hypothetical protein
MLWLRRAVGDPTAICLASSMQQRRRREAGPADMGYGARPQQQQQRKKEEGDRMIQQTLIS